METEPLSLYWRDNMIGLIHGVSWSDFPWKCGRFEPTETDCEVRLLLQWFHNENKSEDPDLTQAPFPEHFLDNWYTTTPDGTKTEVMPPVPNFDDHTIEWR